MKSRIKPANFLSFLLYFALLILAFTILMPFLATGRAFRVDLLPDKGRNFGCATCHINPGGGGARNPFGNDWANIAIPRGDEYVADIADRDSDSDGFTNDEEFDAGTHPGDAKSKPTRPKAVKARGKLLTLWGRIKSGFRR